MRLPDFTNFTPDEKKAVLALLLLTGGGSAVLEIGRSHPRWTPDLKLVAAAAFRPGTGGDSAGVDSAAVAGGAPVAELGAVPGSQEEGAARGFRGDRVEDGPPPDKPVAPIMASVLAGATGSNGPASQNAALRGPATETGTARTSAPADSARSEDKIDINHADEAGLARLPGIGPKMAARIVEDRRTNGLYRRVEDLLRVKGIGPGKLKRLRDHVVIRR